MKKLILFLLIIPIVSLGQTLYEVDKITDIDYNENVIYPNKKDLLDIYIPKKKKFQVIVFFHGGALLRGSKEMGKDKILVLGASGFIGMHLCKKLVEENIKILALIRNKKSKEAKELLKMDIQILETGDLFEKKIFLD